MALLPDDSFLHCVLHFLELGDQISLQMGQCLVHYLIKLFNSQRALVIFRDLRHTALGQVRESKLPELCVDFIEHLSCGVSRFLYCLGHGLTELVMFLLRLRHSPI